MSSTKYEVWIDGECVAKEVDLGIAFDICKAHTDRYYNETEFQFIIKTAGYGTEFQFIIKTAGYGDVFANLECEGAEKG